MHSKSVKLLLVALVAGVGGCSGQMPASDAATTQAAKAKVAAIASAGEAGERRDASADPTQAAENPAANAIDRIAEGKRFRAATRALDRGDFKTAESARAELAQSDQYSALAVAIEALVFAKQGKHEEALRLAEEISAVPVMQGEAYVIAGEVFQRENRLSEAIAAFENALQINPQHVRAHLWIGSIYYDTGAMRLATDHLRTAAALEPTEVNSLLLSGKIYQDYEQYQEAIQDYRAALARLESNDKRLSVQVKMAECLVELRQLSEAEEALRDCPEVASVLAVRALIAEARGEMDKSAASARLALQQAPANRSAGLVLGRILVAERQWDEAVKLLRSLVEVQPEDHESKQLYGRALIGAGEKEAGKAAIQQATELKDAFLKFADLHQEAIKKPEDAAIRLELGRLAEKLGKVDLAKTWYRATVGLEPMNREAIEALQRLK